jgi:hypothetical protein
VTCEAGETNCAGSCIDEKTDPNHCGSCTNACVGPASGATTGTAACASGACSVTCDSATPTVCPSAKGGHACVDLQTDPQSCGACAVHCGGAQTCVGGSCKSACAPGLTACSSGCVNLEDDPNNCASCGNACPSLLNSNNHCSLGGCKMACDAGLTTCTVNALTGLTACVNLQKDATHCGSCSNACAADHVCVAGACQPYIAASACWECGDGNPMATCCQLGGQSICTSAASCP